MSLPCGILAEKCSSCRTLAASFYGQFMVPAPPWQDQCEVTVTDEAVRKLQERIRNEPGDLLLDDFWGSPWPVGRGAEVGEEIRRRVLAYDRLAAEIKRLYLTVL